MSTKLDTTCAKCGNTDSSIEYQPSGKNFNYAWAITYELSKFENFSRSDYRGEIFEIREELLKIGCNTCGFVWFLRPLDCGEKQQ